MRALFKDLKTDVTPFGTVTITFKTDVNNLQKLKDMKTGDYVVTIEPPNNSRTAKQNAYLWQLIGEIDFALNGCRTRGSEEEIYIQLLQMTGSAVEYIECIPKAVNTLKKLFRVVSIVENRNKTVMCKCYVGSSQMNKKEFATLVDKALEYADSVGIDSSYWKGLLKDEEDTARNRN